MAKGDKSFKELLAEAPLAEGAATTTVFGTLARSTEADKFVLTLANGQSVTLPTNAVKSYDRLAGAIGQVLVQLELDTKLLPKELDQLNLENTPAWFDTHKLPIVDMGTLAVPDYPTVVEHTGIVDQPTTGIADHPTTAIADVLSVGTGAADIGGTLAEQIGPYGPVYGGGTVAPFALATPHQAPAETVAALTQMSQSTGLVPYIYFTRPLFDHKTPEQDGTFPGHRTSDY